MGLIAQFEFDGSDGATTTSDSSGVGTKTFTFSGAAALRTAQKQFGTASLNTTGAAGTYLSVASSSEMNRGAGDFSLSFWMRPTISGSETVLSSGASNKPYFGSSAGAWAWNWTTVPNCPSYTLLLNDWHVIGLARSGSQMRVFINGRRCFTTTYSGNIDLTSLTFGRLDYNNNQFFTGHIDRFALHDTCLWDLAYDPLTLIDTGETLNAGLFNPPVKLGAVARPRSEVVVPPSFRLAKRLDWGGTGTVSGTVKIKGTPNYAVARRVLLIHSRSGVCLGETWSDATTGNYSFYGLDKSQTYTVLAYDHTGAFRAVVADSVIPT